MAAQVGSLLNLMNDGDAGNSTAPITRDFLGGCSAAVVDATELDLDLEVPSGWEKRLDLKTGKIYFQAINSATNPVANANMSPMKNQAPNLNDGDVELDLKLATGSSSSPASSNFQSVCTLDKVKSALERAEMAANGRKRSSASPSSASSSSIKDIGVDHDDRSPAATFAAAVCPGCLLYLLVSPGNPKCPRCRCSVPVAEAEATTETAKRPRIDLNLSV